MRDVPARSGDGVEVKVLTSQLAFPCLPNRTNQSGCLVAFRSTVQQFCCVAIQQCNTRTNLALKLHCSYTALVLTE